MPAWLPFLDLLLGNGDLRSLGCWGGCGGIVAYGLCDTVAYGLCDLDDCVVWLGHSGRPHINHDHRRRYVDGSAASTGLGIRRHELCTGRIRKRRIAA
jgi:hypothetical protein